MQVKLFEVRDKLTLIPVMAVLFDPLMLPSNEQEEAERYLLKRSGFHSHKYLSLTKLADGEMVTRYEPFGWKADGTRTLFEAHRHILDNWDELASGAVIDVEFLLGERKEPKKSERLS